MAASTKPSAQSAPQSASPLPEAAASEDAAQAPQSAPGPLPEASAPPSTPPAPDDSRVLLQFTGTTLVVAPFGELDFGEIVAAPPDILDSLLATGLFERAPDAPVDQDAIRHP